MVDVEDRKNSVGTKAVLAFAIVVFLVAGIGTMWRHQTVLSNDRTTAQKDASGRAADGAAELDKALSEVKSAVDQTFDVLHNTSLVDDRPGLERLLLDEVATWPSINGVLYAEAPDEEVGACDVSTVSLSAPYRPYATRISGTLRLERLDEQYVCLDWYEAALVGFNDGGPERPEGAWVKPRVGSFSNTTLGFYSRAVTDADGALAGVLLGTTAVDNLTSRLGWSRVSPHGYSFIVDEDENYVTHPLGQLVEAGCSIRPPAVGTNSCLGVDAPPSGEGILNYSDPVTGGDAWLVGATIETTKWKFWNLDLVDSALPLTDQRSRLLTIAVAAFLGAALFLVSLAALHFGRSTSVQWTISGALAIASLSLVGWIWVLQGPSLGHERLNPSEFGEVAALADSDSTVSTVRVGLFLQSLEFTGANDVAASGLIWQVGPEEAASKPPVFPEATSPVNLDHAWGEPGEESFGWEFSVTLRQEFNYGEYPLDKEQIWLRLWPGDFTSPTVLLPDLDAYLIQAPDARPGLADGLLLEGWDIERSFFATETTPINTELGTIGAPPSQLKPGVPQLFFVVDLQRSFVGPFVSQLIPLAAVNVMLFAVLLLVGPRSRKDDSIGSDTLGVLAYVAALFFVVIVTHNDLRSRLQATELVFLESFYFTTYLLLILVTTNSLLLSVGRGGSLINDEHNLWPKVAYWPLFSVLTLLATLNTFV